MKKILLLAAASLMTLGVAAQSGTDSEKSVTFGDYDNLKESGSDDDGYAGSFYDRAPTTFYMEHTGSSTPRKTLPPLQAIPSQESRSSAITTVFSNSLHER